MSDEKKTKRVAISELDASIPEFLEMLGNELDKSGKPGDEPNVLCISGAPGIGKTSMVEQLAAKKGFRVVTKRCAMIEGVDLNGVPTLMGDTPEDKRTICARPNEFPAWDEKAVIFLDEMNRGKEETIQAAFRMVEGRGTDSWKFNPANHRIVVAINPSNGAYHTTPMDPAMVNRMVKINLRPDIKSFLKYGYGANMDERILQFLSYSNGALHVEGSDEEGDTPWASPRSWDNLSKSINGKSFSNENVLYLYAAGAVGPEIGAQFIAFLADSDRPVRATDVLENFTPDLKKKFVKHQENAINKALSTVMDLTALLNAKFDPKHTKELKEFYKLIDNDEIKTSFIKSLDQGSDSKFDKIVIALGITDEAIAIANEVANVKAKGKK